MCYSCGCNCGCNYDCGCSDNPCTNCATTTTTTFHCDNPSPDVVINSNCVVYTGSTNPCYGILSGSTLTNIISELLLQAANCTPPTTTTTSTTSTTTTTSTSTTSTSTTSTTTTAAIIKCFKLTNTFSSTAVTVNYINESNNNDSLTIQGGEIIYKCGVLIYPTLGVSIATIGLCSAGCAAPTTSTTSTTSTTTSTSTSTTSTTSTSTTTTVCSDPQCAQVLLAGANKLYTYNYCENELAVLSVPGLTSSVNYGVAVNTQFMWASRTPKFTEWMITYSPFVAVSSRDILFPAGFNQAGLFPAGIVAKDSTGYKVVGWNSYIEYFAELDLSGSTATFTNVFDFSPFINRSAVGNPLYTTTDKLISISYDKSTSFYHLTQFNYPTGTIENDINISDSTYNPVGLIMPTCNCTCSLYVIYLKNDGSGSRLIKKVNLTTGAITLMTQSIGSSIDVSCGAAQLPSCTTCPMEIIPTTTTTSSTTTTSTTTTSTTHTTSTTTTTTASPELVYLADVYDCSLPNGCNFKVGQTKVIGENFPTSSLIVGNYYLSNTSLTTLTYKILSLTTGPASVTVDDSTIGFATCTLACASLYA